jgi:hypothetical protein
MRIGGRWRIRCRLRYVFSSSAVIETLREVQQKSPERKCFRMIGGVLVERNVKEVLPALEANLTGVSLSTGHLCLHPIDVISASDSDGDAGKAIQGER